jgi:hypothetical protein
MYNHVYGLNNTTHRASSGKFGYWVKLWVPSRLRRPPAHMNTIRREFMKVRNFDLVKGMKIGKRVFLHSCWQPS